eukprot:SAG31_NODE_26680_length_438_cov_0.820059_1_plen_35_part_10
MYPSSGGASTAKSAARVSLPLYPMRAADANCRAES